MTDLYKQLAVLWFTFVLYCVGLVVGGSNNFEYLFVPLFMLTTATTINLWIWKDKK